MTTVPFKVPCQLSLMTTLTRRWRDRLNLEHWTIAVGWCHNWEEDHHAEMRTSDGLDAEMVLSADHQSHQTWSELRKSVVHEIIHLWTDGMHNAQRALVENLVPRGAMQLVVGDHFTKAHEKAVDGFLCVVLGVPGWEDQDLAEEFQDAQSEPQETEA